MRELDKRRILQLKKDFVDLIRHETKTWQSVEEEVIFELNGGVERLDVVAKGSDGLKYGFDLRFLKGSPSTRIIQFEWDIGIRALVKRRIMIGDSGIDKWVVVLLGIDRKLMRHNIYNRDTDISLWQFSQADIWEFINLYDPKKLSVARKEPLEEYFSLLLGSMEAKEIVRKVKGGVDNISRSC
ncbi:MAG: hypothetical protein KAU62_17380 [Candidatus Heimdallarchaeota archaeon]|nr:hypothetical protein [Candidatus Heimdallarchaeota archaeon]MCG3257881.1 hypothetical protein [Candidatus Heimdallarchaeota archaeon]MCK4612932.1 hypothetical protein [Candidatus Heimdallarchaeota archaeon]